MSAQASQKTLKIVSPFGIKGGIGKSTTAISLAAAIKKLRPNDVVGVIDGTTEQSTLSTAYAADKEGKGLGFWGIVRAILDPSDDPAHARKDLHEALEGARTFIQVVPGTESEIQGVIEFIGCGKRHVKLFENHPDIVGAHGSETAKKVMKAIQDHLGWDWAVVDLPPSTKEVTSRILLPITTATAILVGVGHKDDLSGYISNISTLKGRPFEVEPIGILATRFKANAAGRVAMEMAASIADQFDLELIGTIWERETVGNSRNVEEADGVLAKIKTGLYVSAARPGINGSQRDTAEIAIADIEKVASKLISALVDE